ncbi:MAG: carboxypeptidase-like regulatory domain-containing protein, partial [Bacteroidaceae bacterium]|nr:carboxypeptidase-like regulatory domain-containing protein [Bacteroidaceae bacterium]
MRNLIAFVVATLLSGTLAAQTEVVGKVVDAETGEPLPYASIYVNPNTGTLTNPDGNFKLHIKDVDGDASLRITYVGYESVVTKSSAFNGVLRLKPLSTSLGAVTVRGVKTLEYIKEVIDQLQKGYSKGRRKTANYFYRTTFSNGICAELVESFFRANSAINLRNLTLLSGIVGWDVNEGGGRIGVFNTNVHRVMQLGARTFESERWESCIKPFDKLSSTQKYYTVESEVVGQEDDELVKLTFSEKGNVDLKGKGIVEGTAYISVRDKRLLRFDGDVRHQFMRSGLSRAPERIHFSVTYDYSKGYAEPEILSIEGGGMFEPNVLSKITELDYRTLLFRVDADSLTHIKGTPMGTEMLSSIQQAGYDRALWDKYDVIRRTEKEERIAFGVTPDESLEQQEATPVPMQKAEIANEKLQALIDYQERFARIIPQEKVYIHMDNTCYFQGDTIWFSA